MKKLLTALFILFIAHYSFSQSEVSLLTASHKVLSVLNQVKFDRSTEDSTAIHKTAATADASAISTFYARRNKKNVELTWQPPTEESKSVFIVQRRSGGEWETIAYIPCSSTSNDQLPSVYTYIDVNTSKNETEYRVKEEIDHGNTRPSSELAVESERYNSFSASAGYGKVHLTFKTDDVRDIKIYNDKGQLVKETNQVSEKNVQIAVQASGTLHLLVREQSTGSIVAAEVYPK